jgi:hypothetical protein
MGDAQSVEGALELGTRIPVIGHEIMAKETQAIGVGGPPLVDGGIVLSQFIDA